MVLPGVAFAQHAGDIALGIAGGQIATGRFVANQPVLDERVFVAEFGAFPNFTDSPGFDGVESTFAPGSQIGFDILKALRKWDGMDFDAIPPETLRIRLGPSANTRLTPTTDQVVAGFGMPVNSFGEYHHHYQYTLQAPASNGVYLLELRLWSTQAGLNPSEPFWIVFDQNSDQASVEAAAAWVKDNFLPTACPADLNGDGFVDDTDFVLFAQAYDAFVCSGTCAEDLNGDGFVDDTDFVLFAQAYDAFICP